NIWGPSAKLNLSYCFDRSWDEVPGLRAQAVAALETSTLAWESAADINFVATAHGDACSHASARFVVRYRGDSLGPFGLKFRGLAFFPNAPEEDRYLTLWIFAFDDGP